MTPYWWFEPTLSGAYRKTPNLIRDSDFTFWASGCYQPFMMVHSFHLYEMSINHNKHWWTPWRPTWKYTGNAWFGDQLAPAGFRVIPSARD